MSTRFKPVAWCVVAAQAVERQDLHTIVFGVSPIVALLWHVSNRDLYRWWAVDVSGLCSDEKECTVQRAWRMTAAMWWMFGGAGERERDGQAVRAGKAAACV